MLTIKGLLLQTLWKFGCWLIVDFDWIDLRNNKLLFRSCSLNYSNFNIIFLFSLNWFCKKSWSLDWLWRWVKLRFPSVTVIRRCYVNDINLRQSIKSVSFSMSFCYWNISTAFCFLSLSYSSQYPFGVGGSHNFLMPFETMPFSAPFKPVFTFFY